MKIALGFKPYLEENMRRIKELTIVIMLLAGAQVQAAGLFSLEHTIFASGESFVEEWIDGQEEHR